ncbi:uncharacterized protein LOC129883473 [Solanum dulcamara]|uniref:uncharacterized protein LOC129883473 n=1 Tax=Solanum dulcamara TaxID=45834 RepID=UPI002485B137|nr:uncharacterized protein LOC129883473 [Solanum dulcamara]
MRVEIQKNRELSNLAIAANTPVPGDGRPPIHFPSPSSSTEHVQNPSLNPTQNAFIIDLTTSNLHHASASYQAPPHPQNTNPQSFPPPQNTNPQACPPPQNQNVNNPQTFPHHQNQHTNRQTFPQNYQVPQNTPNPPIIPPLPQKTAFQIPISNEPYTNGSELDHYEEQEREWRTKDEVTKQSMKEEIIKAMKEFHYTPDVVGLNYEDLCIHPDLDLPEGFKVPKFDTFGGTGNPLAHLRAYCDQLVGVGKNEALLMRLFSQSLSGEALEWFTSQEMKQWPNWNALAKEFIERFAYNVEIVPDHYSLEKIKQKSTESYREYAYRWRKEASRVRPPMTEKEIIEVFVRNQEPEYYDRILLLVGAKFAEVVKIGETIEDGLKTGRITCVAIQTSSSDLFKKKREDVSFIFHTPNRRIQRSSSFSSRKTSPSKIYPPSPQNPYPIFYVQSSYETLPPNYLPPHYQNAPRGYQTQQRPNFRTPAAFRQNRPSYRHVPPPPQNNYNLTQPNFENRPARSFTPLVESRTKLFERLRDADIIHPIAPKSADTSSRFFRADQICAYHSNSVGHDTETCVNLRHKIPDLIDREVVTLQTATPNINNNPLPNHEGVNVNMIEVGKDWNADSLDKSDNLKKPLPHVCQSFSVQEPVNNVGLGEGVSDAMIIETSGI